MLDFYTWLSHLFRIGIKNKTPKKHKQNGKCIKLEENTGENIFDLQFSSVQSLSHVQLFATPWTAAHQSSLSITNSRGLPKLMSIELVGKTKLL